MKKIARSLFTYSLSYLFVIFLALITDRVAQTDRMGLMADASVAPTDEEVAKRRRRRNSIALGLVLAALVLIFYALTIVKMGPPSSTGTL